MPRPGGGRKGGKPPRRTGRLSGREANGSGASFHLEDALPGGRDERAGHVGIVHVLRVECRDRVFAGRDRADGVDRVGGFIERAEDEEPVVAFFRAAERVAVLRQDVLRDAGGGVRAGGEVVVLDLESGGVNLLPASF